MAEQEPKSSTEPPCDSPLDTGGGQEEIDGGRRRSKSKKPKQDPRLITDGLLVSMRGHKQPFVSYTYALTTLMESGTRVDWKILSPEGVESQHVRLHTLQPGDTLNSIATTYRKTYTVAVILVNTEDNLELSPEVTEGAVQSKKTAFPIAIISSEDGKSLREFLNRYDTGELNAKLEAKNQPHIELKPRPLGGSSPGSESTVTVKSRGRGFGYSFRRKGKRSFAINLKDEIKPIMFPVTGPVCVSEDEERFKAIMTIFYQYEQSVQRGSQPAGSSLFQKFTKHIDEMFARDFPFYLLVAYRVHKKQTFYLCDELRPFVRMCVEKFERLEPVSIAKTLETFFLKMEDFNLMFESDNVTHSIYQLIEEACIVLMDFSFTLKTHDASMPLHRAVYYRMLWISAACKCHVQRNTGPREHIDYWRERLTAVEDFTHLNTDIIQSVKRGVEFGRLLQLPDEASFTSFHMADILTAKGLVRPLYQLREFVIVLEPYVQPEEDFVTNFMTKPRECYQQVKSEAWRAAHSDANMLAIIPEGLGYLDTILEVSRKRQWQSSSLDEEMKQWLTILLQPVDVTSSSAESHLKDFLTTKSGGVTKQYKETIKREVIIKLEESLGKLSVEQFIQLYKAFLIWPNWIVQKFLKQYKIPDRVKISSRTWNEFLVVFVDRFTDAQHHKFVLDFLKCVAQTYLKQGRAKDFLLDLLHLDVPNLFVMDSHEGSDSALQSDLLAESVPDEFTHFLSDYIQRNSLHDVILKEIETIWNLIADHSEFQQLILQVLQQELIPESGSLHGPLNVPMKFLLEKCVSTICSGLDSLHDLTSRLAFCWGVVGSCCQKMPLSENLDWISIYYSVIDQLGRIYATYQTKQDTKSILTEDSMSSEVTECTAEGVGIFFKWISQAQQVLGTWRDKLNAKEVNYDDILLYFKLFSQINRAAVLLSAESLVVDMQYMQAMKQDFLQSFELLNFFLLRYISGQPENGWCSLLHIFSSYGVNLPPNILLAIKKYVSFPGEGPNTTKKALSLEHPIPSAISGTFCPSGELQLEVTRELTAAGLKKLVSAVATFLEPIKDLNFLSFFFLCDSEIFDKHLKLQLRKLDPKEPPPGPPPSLSLMSISVEHEPEIMKGIHITHLGKAIEHTKDFILRLIVGNASYMEIVAEGSLSLRSLDIDLEFSILGQYVDFSQINPGNAEGLDGVKAMLQLFQYTRHIKVIHSVCNQYSLVNCLEDPNLKELVGLVDDLELEENRDKLTANDAIEKMKKVTQVLCLEAGQNPRFLDIFSAVQDSADFHRFVVHEKKFVGKSGQELFQQQFQLITTQLQHEEYNEAVLNHLFAAFKLITPFTDTEQNFTQLMISVASRKPVDARRQLDTVNRNINLIRLWFFRAEGDTLQGVSTELRCVLKSGYYTFVFSSGSVSLSATTEVGSIQLHYIPHSTLYQNVGEVTDAPSLPTEHTWNEEAVSDFVRKLGFLDAEGSAAHEIDQFLHINQTATKLLGLYSKLRELGHPNFLDSPLTTELVCSFTKEEANDLVCEASQLLSQWEKEVTYLRAEYEQLLFFSIPKLLHLYQNLMAAQPNPTDIVHDVGFLFENKPHVQSQLKETVKELLQSKPHFHQDDSSGATPMHIVGAFLSALFGNLALSGNSLKRRRKGSVGSVVSRSSSSSQSTHILHSCTGFSQSQLLRLVISIYGGVPEAFEVYHCRATSTEEEIRLFMNPKRATKRPFQYLILEVNKLPYRLQEALVRIHFDLKQSGSSDETDAPCVHFIETGPSLLQEMPWLLRMDYKGAEPLLDFAEASSTCKNAALDPEDFRSLQLVYGRAGDGKTHYIENQMIQCPEYLRIAVNEAFTPLSAIKKLCSVDLDEPESAVFFNFTLLPPGQAVSEDERKIYDQLIESIGWFFFDLFILGYVEDPATGHSFRFPGGVKISIYVEVPSRVEMDSETSLREFHEDVPALGLLGTKYFIEPNTPFVVDNDVQLVCKYLKAYKTGGTKGIDRLYKDGGSSLFGRSKPSAPVKFSLEPDLSEAECRKLLDRYTPQHMSTNKATQKLFIKYMKRRCAFLDNCPAFNYNPGSSEYTTNAKGERKKNDTTQLGSTLMHTMLKEVSDFCDPFIKEDWALKPHHQLVYDFKDGGGSIGLMSLHPDQISNEEKDKFRKIGVQMPSMFELYSRECLDSFLSRALDVPLNEYGRLSPVDDSAYVLTLDFALKMLNIHERAEGGVPVIIEGETGVGKTALIGMLSKLWNYALFNTWNVYKDRIMDYIKLQLEKLPASSFKKHSGSMESITAIAQSGSIREDDLMTIAEIPLDADKQFYSVIRAHLLELAGDPVLSILEVREEDSDNRGLTVPMLVASAQYKDNPKDTARLLFKFLNSRVKNLFFKLNVHAALEPASIISFFRPIFEQARTLQRAYDRFTTQVKVPFITVFLDEVNTSSCLGLFKEVIIDRTLDGEPIPSNVFIVGACNPHRGNSLAAHGSQETWIRATYYVRQLHPTIRCLMWDYGALGEQQERDYILAKMKISNRGTANADLANLTELIVMSQNLMRKYALEQLKNCGLSDAKSSEFSRSCVSQRDIQRVFTFYEWLSKMYQKYKPFGEQCDYNSRAVAIALGLVYYLRLDTLHRKKYQDVLDHEMAPSQLSFSKSFKEELDWYISHIDLPKGIARTQALKENLFATIICTMTHTPLIIVGSPGSSKTLSFNLTLANLKGQESKVPQFRETDVFKSLDPQMYQCSRRTTSNEISTVFNRAINRQRSHQSIPLPVYCVVFMDEAGLPEERHESLKVLHYYLDTQEVSFVAISNHVLDAAKTNRAASVFRPQASREELMTLAKGCLCDTPEDPPPELRKDMNHVASFCPAYEALMAKPRFARFFGLRDFINFISYLRRKRLEMLSPELVMEALERNFNGVSKEDFHLICKLFLRAVNSSPEKVDSRNILDILCSSIIDHPVDTGAENEMRYKLIIDSSNDGSLVRLLFSTGVLQRNKTRVYVCSDFPGDAELQKVNTIAAIRHSVTEGHTVVLSQTDSIHESFYDLFNRRFHRIDEASGPRYYANISIGAHIKPCRVHRDFDCVVVVKQSEVESIPPPFLNRFEKYFLSHELVLEATLSNVPPALAAVLRAALEKASEFVEYISGSSSLYGLQKETLSSLLMSLLPSLGHDYDTVYEEPTVETQPLDVKFKLLETLLKGLKENAGFPIPSFSKKEMLSDAEEVLSIIMLDSEFSGQVLRIMSTESKTGATQLIHLAMVEALHALHLAESVDQYTREVSANACMMVSILTQWLVRHLCKRVMQLMTSEALCMHHRKIPTSYIQAYLNHQHHFSLKELLEAQATKLTEEKTCASSKLVCFMRSSSPLHQLPAQFPTPIHRPSSSTEDASLLQELVFTKTEQLVVHKMSSITTFSNVNELLKNYVSSPTQRVLLMVVNMEDTTKELVNHLRIMIEEAESKCASKNKLFALLLHFQTCRLNSPCYPVMFLPGWDFNYLEMIGYSPRGGVLDIRDWFRQCYGTSSAPDHSIAPHLSALLREAIPAISSRVSFKKQLGAPFNCEMKIPERNRALERLFFDKGVGEVLCERFNSYWTSSVMVEYLEKAALHAQQHESPNVIDNLQTNFKSLFVDFLVYMVYEMNKGMNVDVLFDPDCKKDTIKLFLDILRIVPIPKLPEIAMLRVANDTSALKEDKEIFSPPKFPYFSRVSLAIERLVDQTRRDLNQHLDVLDDQAEGLLCVLQSSERSRAQTMSSMFKSLQSKLADVSQDEEKSILSVGVDALLSVDCLWNKYLEDFTHQKLHLEYGSSGISDKVLSAAFGKLENRSPVQRLAILHVYVHVHKLNLAKVVSILRPLDQVEDAVLTLTSMAVNPPSSTQSLLDDVEDGSDLLGCSEALSSFIMNTLFNAIAGISMTYFAQGERELEGGEIEQVKLWFKAYKDVMSMPALREHIYVSRSTTSEAQHSAMHALFLMVRSKPLGDVETLKQGLHIFNKIFNQYFTTRSELQGAAPRLEHIVSAVLEGLPLSSPTDLSQPRRILEGLLYHFFSQYRTVYNTEDVMWFLELANRQTKWQASYIMDQVDQFTYSEDLNAVFDMTEDDSEEVSVEKLAAGVPIAVFRFFLRRIILSSIKKAEDPIHSVMLFFNKAEAHKLITKVLCSNQDLGRAGPFIPTFYQLCDYSISPSPSAENKLMQQPLAHLYFLTVMEDLLDSNYGLSGLIKTSHNISKCEHWFEGHVCNCCDDQCTDGSSTGCQLVLLHIEEQAIVQVIIKEAARHLDPKDTSKINALFAVLPDLNAILDDMWMGGGSVGGHGLTLVMHLLREKQSFRMFLDMLTTNYSMLSDGINCLEPFHTALAGAAPVSHSVAKTEQQFMPYQDMGADVQLLYSRVIGCMNAIHSSHGSSAKSREKEFVRLSEEYSSGELNVITPSGTPATMNKLACFRMTLWLATYNEFFTKKRQSKALAQIVANLSKRIGTQCAQLIQCFLDPDLMNRRSSHGESVRSASGQGPLYSLFSTSPQDNNSSSDLQRALVHLITTVLASPPNKTSLWYLLFNAEQVPGSYIPGFMYDSPVGPDTKFYDYGVELTEDGFYSCMDTIEHVTRGTLGLHSLYSLLWANFSSFFIALLTQPNAAEKLSGKLFSSGTSVLELCSSQMMKLWELLHSGLCVSKEERLLLVGDCLNRFMEQQLTPSSNLRGKLSSHTDLDLCERNWHCKIFTPAWNTLKNRFEKTSSFLKMPVIKDIIKLDARYPWAPGVKSLTDTILSSDSIGDPSNQLYPLSRFVVEYPRLRVSVELLPSILELYQWLHSELTFAVSYEQATSITLGRLSKVLTRHSMLNGVSKLKEMFNNYVQMTGCTRHMRPVTLGDDTPLLHLLSCSSDHSSDLLFTVLKDVIIFLNQFFETLLRVVKGSVVSDSLFPTSSPKVTVMEFVHHYMLIARTGSGGDLLQLIHGRTLLPPAYPTDTGKEKRQSNSSLPGQLSKLIDLLPLQEDILALSIVGMPLIDPTSIASLRMPFKFKEDSSESLRLQDYAMDLEGIASKLPEPFQRPLDETYRKRLEYEFHCAGYHTVIEVITGLRTAIGHLIKDVSDDKEIQEERFTELLSQKLPGYLISLYEYDPQDSTTDVFHEIGINSLSQTQRGCLDGLSLDNLFHTRKLFVGWAEDGLYDFCSLPFGVKKHMNVLDEDALSMLHDTFEGSPADLLKTLRSLVDILVHLESSIVKAASTKPQRSIVRFLKKLNVCNNMDVIQTMIPETVRLENYVTLRLALRRLVTQVQSYVSQSEMVTPEPREEKWNDFIQEFWENHLPHFRRHGYVYRTVSPSSSHASDYPENTESSSKILDELFRCSSETNILTTIAEEELTSESSSVVEPTLVDDDPKPKEETSISSIPKEPAVSDEELLKIAKKVTVQQVVEFLQNVKLDQYATTFEESDINGEILVQFQDGELEEMEIDSALDRLKIAVFFKRFLLKSKGLAPEVIPAEEVAKVLKENRQLRQYAKTFLDNGVDGELLLSASDEVMRELGVEKGAHRLMIRNKFNTHVK